MAALAETSWDRYTIIQLAQHQGSRKAPVIINEAVTKLAVWYYHGQERQLTSGLQIFLNHYKNHTYPGLPTLKKLSIMHHLELIGRYLDGESNK